MTHPWILLAIFVFISYTTEAITGFGSIVIAVGLGAMVLPISDILPVVVPLNILTSSYLTYKYRAHIHWRTVLALILPAMAAGTLVGNYLKPYLGNTVLKSLFGLLILWFALRELTRLHRKRAQQQAPRSPNATRGWIGAAGITHGLFASGGPLLVYALAGQPLDKTTLRSTLLLVWLILNTLLSALYLLDGSLVAHIAHTVWFVPIIISSTLLGEYLHSRINERQFRQAVFVVLAIAGLFLAIPRHPAKVLSSRQSRAQHPPVHASGDQPDAMNRPNSAPAPSAR